MPSRPPPEARMAPTPEGWRCTCMVFVLPGEEHRCFYRDILAVLDRIAVQLEARPPPPSMTTTPIPPLDLMRFK